MREQQEEAAKIILTEEEFNFVKPLATNPTSRPPVSSEKIVKDEEVDSNADCRSLSLNDLLIMFRTGKKRDLIVETGFIPTASLSFYKNRSKSYNQIYNTDKITYSRCFYGDSYDNSRYKIVVSHTAYDYLYYWTTVKKNYEDIESELLAAGGKMVDDNLSCNNCGDVTRVFSFHGGEIELEHRRKSTNRSRRDEYEVKIRRSIPTDVNIDESRKVEIDSFNLYLQTL